jgi:hypothetical protein
MVQTVLKTQDWERHGLKPVNLSTENKLMANTAAYNRLLFIRSACVTATSASLNAVTAVDRGGLGIVHSPAIICLK